MHLSNNSEIVKTSFEKRNPPISKKKNLFIFDVNLMFFFLVFFFNLVFYLKRTTENLQTKFKSTA